MNAKRLVGTSVMAAGLAISALTAGLGAPQQPSRRPATRSGAEGRGGHQGGPGDHPEARQAAGNAVLVPGGPGDRGPSPWDHNAHWGPPHPDQAWRGIDQGRFDHQPFNHNGSWVTPIFNPDFNNWGFWFFGIGVPL